MSCCTALWTSWCRGVSRALSPFHQLVEETLTLPRAPPVVAWARSNAECMGWANSEAKPWERGGGVPDIPTGEDTGPALSGLLTLPSSPPPPRPALFPQCLWSRKIVARPSFSITENLQVVPKHLRTSCQAFNFNSWNVTHGPEKSNTLLTGLLFLWLRC